MQPIKICRFHGFIDVTPQVEICHNLEQFMAFFTVEPPTLKKAERCEFFSMAIFKPGTTRCKQNVTALSGIVLDFDNTTDKYFPLPEFVQSLEKLGVIYLYYTTWSHTEAHHRWRLVLPFANPVEAKLWTHVHAYVLQLLGNPSGIDTAASIDVARMWIMPCKAPGQPYSIGYQTNGNFLDPQKLLSISSVLIAPAPSPITGDTNPLSKLSKTTANDVREALGYIDPDVNYDTWIAIGMALCHEFGASGIYIWDAWSAKGCKYKNFQDLQTHWQSFGRNKGVTIATLFHHAKMRGYFHHHLDLGNTSDKRQHHMRQHLNVNTLDSSINSPLPDNFTATVVAEVQEYTDPINQCVNALRPFVVRDIFDFPCALTQRVYEWIQSVAPLPQPIFSFSATLSVMAFLKRHAVVSPTNLKTNLYVMVIGPSRSGKNNTLDAIYDILKSLELQEFAVSGFGSAQGLMKQLSERNGQAYWLQDEISHLFKNFQNKNAGTYETRLEQKILTLYNCSYQTSDKIKHDKMFVVQNPSLNIFGTTTENIIEILSPESVVSGLLARFLVFWLKPTDITADYRTQVIDRSLPKDLISALKTIAEQPQLQKVLFSPEAEAWLQTFSKTLQQSQQELCKKGAKVDALVGNLREQTIKIALFVAKHHQINLSTTNQTITYQTQLAISLEDIQWAASVVLHCFFNNIELACSLTENKNEKYIHKILQYLKEHQEKWIRRSSLCQLLRYAINTHQLEDLLATLLESQAIIKTTGHGGALYRLNQPLTTVSRSRNNDYSLPPPQIRTGAANASGSCLR